MNKHILRAVMRDTGGATVHLECGHIIDRSPGRKQPARRRCKMCEQGPLTGHVAARTLATIEALCRTGDLGSLDVRRGGDGKMGIYLRNFNVRLATFNDNTTPVQRVLKGIFDAAAD